MQLQLLHESLTVCQVATVDDVDLHDDIFFLCKTDEELSLVCKTDSAPAATLSREDGWRGFRITGVLDFSLIGILSKISAILAEKEIGIFAVSTYNTDYILVKEENLDKAVAALTDSGYTFI